MLKCAQLSEHIKHLQKIDLRKGTHTKKQENNHSVGCAVNPIAICALAEANLEICVDTEREIQPSSLALCRHSNPWQDTQTPTCTLSLHIRTNRYMLACTYCPSSQLQILLHHSLSVQKLNSIQHISREFYQHITIIYREIYVRQIDIFGDRVK